MFRRLAFLWLVAIVAAGLVGAATIKMLAPAQGGGPQAYGPQATPVEVRSVEPMEFVDLVEALGTARANESVTITSKVTEIISRIAFESGDFVKAGDVLAELADAEEAANLAQARANLAEAERELGRSSELSTRGVAAQQSIDTLATSLERAKAQVAQIEARLADRIVKAPFDGVVGLRNASPGMLVRPGDVIATLDDVSVIKLDFTVPENFLAVITPGVRLQATTAAFAEEKFVGEVSQVDSRVDPVTRSATVRALIDNKDRRLVPGMLMVVEVVRDRRETLAVPELAIFRQGDSAFVYVVEKGERGSTAVRRKVDTRSRSDGMIEITAGLERGDLVVAAGTHRLRDGAPVVVTEGGAPARVAAAGDGA